MKLTLQLVIVVLNTQKKFRDNLLKFTLHTVSSSRYYTYPHPTREGTFPLDPLPLEFPFHGVLVRFPAPWNFRNFPTWLGTPWRE